jgi:RNA-directed DNA polymerase
MRASALISVLARSLLAGEPLADQVHARAARTLGRSWRWLRPLASRYAAAFAATTPPRHRDVIRFLRDDQGFARALQKYRPDIAIAHWMPEPSRMQPVAAAQLWNLPRRSESALPWQS